MAKQEINLGTGPNTGTGDSLRNAFGKINENFTEVYDTAQSAFEAANNAFDTLDSSIINGFTSVSIPEENGDVVIDLDDNNSVFRFKVDGTLELPEGGTIVEGVVTENPTIELTPANPEAESQKLVIKGGFPIGQEPHLHLTTGDLQETNIFLGTDEHNVRTKVDGGVELTSYDYDNQEIYRLTLKNNVLKISSTADEGDEDLFIKAEDDLYLDALGDDVIVRAEDDIRLRTGFNFIETSYAYEWRFNDDGALIFYSDDDGFDYGYIRMEKDEGENKGLSIEGYQTVEIKASSNSWKFNEDGTLTTPNNIVVDEGMTISQNALTGTESVGVLYLNSAPEPNTYIHLTNENTALIVANTNVTVVSNSDENAYTWNFANTGTLTFPDGAYIANSGFYAGDGKNAVLSQNDGNTQVYTQETGVGIQTYNSIEEEYKTWTFDTEGALILPGDGNAKIYDNGGYITLEATDGANLQWSDGEGKILSVEVDNSKVNLSAVDSASNSQVDVLPNKIDIIVNSKTWSFANNGILTIPGSTIHVTDELTFDDTPIAIDVTKSVHKLANGSYTLSDGEEGQFLYLVPQTGTTPDGVEITINNARVVTESASEVRVGDSFLPFSGSSISNLRCVVTMIFTDGAWNLSSGEQD
jgi:hypothetical protein